MCRVKAQRDATTCRGSEALFFRHQKPVDWVKVRRYLRDSPGTIDKLRVLIAHDRCRPGCIEKILPHDTYVISHQPPRVIRGERRSEEIEQTLLALRDHWVAGKSEMMFGFEHIVQSTSIFLQREASLTEAPALLTSLEIRNSLDKASEVLAEDIKAGRPWASFSIMTGSLVLKEYRGLPELAQHFVSYAVDLCQLYLPPQHPIAIAVRTLSSVLLGADQLRALVHRCLDLRYNMEQSVSSVDHMRKLTALPYRAQFADMAEPQVADDLLRLGKEAHRSPAQVALILSHAAWHTERKSLAYLMKREALLVELHALACKGTLDVHALEASLFHMKIRDSRGTGYHRAIILPCSNSWVMYCRSREAV